MKVTALIPVYNRQKFIIPAIESLTKQTYKDIDILIYDDGSIDSSVQTIKLLQRSYPNITLIQGMQNKGVAAARNILLDNCQTQYAFWHDSDDISEPNRVELQVSEVGPKGCMIFTDWLWIKFIEQNKTWSPSSKPQDSKAFATLMFYVDKNIRFNETKIAGEDWDWIGRMQKRYLVKNVKKVLYLVRFHNDRIGSWKTKLRNTFSKNELETIPYGELLQRYKALYYGN